MSISVYNANTGLWQQTWADNQAGYIVLGLGLGTPPNQDSAVDLELDAYPGERTFCQESAGAGGTYSIVHVLDAQ